MNPEAPGEGRLRDFERRMLATLDHEPATEGRRVVSRGFVYRHDVEKASDGLAGKGTFGLCTSWLVGAFTRTGGPEKVRLIFERMPGYANHPGLYAEEIGPSNEPWNPPTLVRWCG